MPTSFPRLLPRGNTSTAGCVLPHNSPRISPSSVSVHCLQVDTDSAPDLVNYLVGVYTNTTRLGAVLFTSLKLRAPPGTYTLPFSGTPVGG